MISAATGSCREGAAWSMLHSRPVNASHPTGCDPIADSVAANTCIAPVGVSIACLRMQLAQGHEQMSCPCAICGHGGQASLNLAAGNSSVHGPRFRRAPRDG